MEILFYIFTFALSYVSGEIRDSRIVNRLIKIKPVGANVGKTFVPLTEIPPPDNPHIHSGRRHLEDCVPKPEGRDVYEGAKIDIFAEYYDDKVAKTVATVVIPDHIDRKHFEVTSPVPYLTVGHIDAIGYHPSTIKSEHPSECEKIYQDHLAEQYSDETTDYSEESLEMARMPLFPQGVPPSAEERFDKMYSDIDV
ncbi:uncharacterized protein LOC115453475 [Manduca sexta]|uniref:Uncharacterized protein n=1 Tax=Manduca sexta TaxID=7130 RepID=A0A921ZWT0_MANSE|nr:uncharacterized protein LOC115453475 [Manduca sexta]KAG6464981.1 hypothetical protein O3G_MSEX014854 [Manduca sexta]